ncbi:MULTISPECIES: response regulator transcription factor [unclassified Rhizobium]|jgi:two-component system phosphate regulon response regulator PhoB|uniref:winged helix-turn-helix transcriptional regulator n=1 Tax=unclassified Rhizobium TaxID=2613769 RepID=UPI000647ACE4|nr:MULTISPECIES: response regulator transcription factor [unclassified Rhizobium]OJY78704.1 MAG: hypothetical protein BGP09_33190 [Rhizobium sp. 60-20]RKD52204.1 two-component system phosphate regulon response regulator PhoB [Rhizobium sp. WW_1]
MEFRILVCAQDVQIFLLLRHVLATEGFMAFCVDSLKEAEDRLCDPDVRAVIADCSTCAVDAASLRNLKIARFDLSIALFCNRPNSQLNEAGADLVLAHPFDPACLIGFLRRLRLDALIERNDARAEVNILRFADLEMNIATAKVRRNGHALVLTALQFRLLRYLLMSPKAVRSREELIAAAWPMGIDVEPRTVDIHIGHIRRALKRAGPDLVRTVRARGYALDLEYEACD